MSERYLPGWNKFALKTGIEPTIFYPQKLVKAPTPNRGWGVIQELVVFQEKTKEKFWVFRKKIIPNANKGEVHYEDATFGTKRAAILAARAFMKANRGKGINHDK